MENWLPRTPSEILILYASLIALGTYFLFRKRPRQGMLLRLRGVRRLSEQFSHIQPSGERPLNVMFNYNGHSWDAYEVLGLPAGSSLEKVQAAYASALEKVDEDSRGFLEAAHQAILQQWDAFKKAR